MSQKIIVLALSLFLVVFIAGCGKKDADKPDQPDISNVEQTKNQGNEKAKDAFQKKELPAEAVVACSDKSEGDSCETMMSKGNEENETISGACKKMAENDQLVCMPGGRPGGPGGLGGPRPDIK